MKQVMFVVAAIAGVTACGGGGDAASRQLPPVTILSPDTANHIGAQYSPDGSRIYWWQLTGAVFQLWTADSVLGGAKPLEVTAAQAFPLLWSPDGSSIAVPSSKTGIVNIALLTSTGEVRPLVDAPYATGLGWHPDGDRLSYLTSQRIAGDAVLQSAIVSVRDGGAAPLIPDEANPMIGRWTPDGTHIVFFKLVDGRSYLWVADSTGRNARQLTTDGLETPVRGPDWTSPDSKQIAYTTRRTGTQDIWVAAIDGNGARQLTRDVREDFSPYWSPDGKWIAFVSERGKQTDVWMVPAAGGEEVRVTDDAAVERLVGWLPEGRLAFLTGTPTGSVWSADVASGRATRLTDDSIVIRRFSPSPDGSRFVMMIERGGGTSDLALVPTAGGPVRIVVSGGATTDFIWSPDGRRVAFASNRKGSSDIWLYDADVDSLRQLTTWPDEEYYPVWKGDGSAVYFLSNRSSKLTDIWSVPVAGGDPVQITNVGTITTVVAAEGDDALYAGVSAENGSLHTVKITPDGAFVPLRTVGASMPWIALTGGDSLAIVERRPGGIDAIRLISTDGRGDGMRLLDDDARIDAITIDGRYVTYVVGSGSNGDVMLLDRKTGVVTQITSSAVNEDGPEVTPDGKTVIYRQRRDIRRIAIADVRKLLAEK